MTRSVGIPISSNSSGGMVGGNGCIVGFGGAGASTPSGGGVGGASSCAACLVAALTQTGSLHLTAETYHHDILRQFIPNRCLDPGQNIHLLRLLRQNTNLLNMLYKRHACKTLTHGIVHPSSAPGKYRSRRSPIKVSVPPTIGSHKNPESLG